VMVNGKPAKGLWNNNFANALTFRANPTPGQPIADIDAGGIFQCFWHILQPDGTYVGTITDRGQDVSGVGHTIVGGAGAFFGVIGEHRLVEQSTPPRAASTTEDPSMRRTNGGGRQRMRFILYPRIRPEFQITMTGPAVFHAGDFSQVTPSNPARAGELLTARVTGLGPTKPLLEPPGARQFSANPLEEASSPIEVIVNGNGAEVINKIGWPGETNVYRIDFILPDSALAGSATLRLIAAWIPGSEVTIPVR
jgi:hypothetical protein